MTEPTCDSVADDTGRLLLAIAAARPSGKAMRSPPARHAAPSLP
jgi:hypothetical protein